MRFLIFLAINLLLYVPLFPQSDQDSIIIDDTSINYGEIEQGSSGIREIKFTNKGSSHLAVSDIIASCSCMTVSWEQQPILPGQQGRIKNRYNTAETGRFMKTITVYSNASNSPPKLSVFGNVLSNNH